MITTPYSTRRNDIVSPLSHQWSSTPQSTHALQNDPTTWISSAQAYPTRGVKINHNTAMNDRDEKNIKRQIQYRTLLNSIQNLRQQYDVLRDDLRQHYPPNENEIPYYNAAHQTLREIQDKIHASTERIQSMLYLEPKTEHTRSGSIGGSGGVNETNIFLYPENRSTMYHLESSIPTPPQQPPRGHVKHRPFLLDVMEYYPLGEHYRLLADQIRILEMQHGIRSLDDNRNDVYILPETQSSPLSQRITLNAQSDKNWKAQVVGMMKPTTIGSGIMKLGNNTGMYILRKFITPHSIPLITNHIFDRLCQQQQRRQTRPDTQFSFQEDKGVSNDIGFSDMSAAIDNIDMGGVGGDGNTSRRINKQNYLYKTLIRNELKAALFENYIEDTFIDILSFVLERERDPSAFYTPPQCHIGPKPNNPLQTLFSTSDGGIDDEYIQQQHINFRLKWNQMTSREQNILLNVIFQQTLRRYFTCLQQHKLSTETQYTPYIIDNLFELWEIFRQWYEQRLQQPLPLSEDILERMSGLFPNLMQSRSSKNRTLVSSPQYRFASTAPNNQVFTPPLSSPPPASPPHRQRQGSCYASKTEAQKAKILKQIQSIVRSVKRAVARHPLFRQLCNMNENGNSDIHPDINQQCISNACSVLRVDCHAFSQQCRSNRRPNTSQIPSEQYQHDSVFPLSVETVMNLYIGTDCAIDLKSLKQSLTDPVWIGNYLELLFDLECNPQMRQRISRGELLYTLLDCGGDRQQCIYKLSRI